MKIIEYLTIGSQKPYRPASTHHWKCAGITEENSHKFCLKWSWNRIQNRVNLSYALRMNKREGRRRGRKNVPCRGNVLCKFKMAENPCHAGAWVIWRTGARLWRTVNATLAVIIPFYRKWESLEGLTKPIWRKTTEIAQAQMYSAKWSGILQTRLFSKWLISWLNFIVFPRIWLILKHGHKREEKVKEEKMEVRNWNAAAKEI